MLTTRKEVRLALKRVEQLLRLPQHGPMLGTDEYVGRQQLAHRRVGMVGQVDEHGPDRLLQRQEANQAVVLAVPARGHVSLQLERQLLELGQGLVPVVHRLHVLSEHAAEPIGVANLLDELVDAVEEQGHVGGLLTLSFGAHTDVADHKVERVREAGQPRVAEDLAGRTALDFVVAGHRQDAAIEPVLGDDFADDAGHATGVHRSGVVGSSVQLERVTASKKKRNKSE